MNRRDVLVLGGSVLIAGCTGSGQQNRAERETQSPTASPEPTETETTEKAEFGTPTPTPTPTPRPRPYIEGERGVEGKVVENTVSGLKLELFRAKFYEDQGYFNVGTRAINTTSNTITGARAVCRFYSESEKIGERIRTLGDIPADEETIVEFLLRDRLDELDNFTIRVTPP